MSKTEKWIVRLGQVEWARFAQQRDTDPYELIGSVRRGASMGALAVTPEGRYLQVNGDYVSSLNTHELRRAVQAAKPPVHRAARPASTPVRSSSVPVVVIKRRRVVASVVAEG